MVTDVAANQVTGRLYAVNAQPFASVVSVLDGMTLNVIGTVPVAEGPGSIALNASTNRVYVTSNDNVNTLTVIDGSTNAIITEILIPGQAFSSMDVAVNPATNRVYVLNFITNIVTVIDGATNSILKAIALPIATPLHISVNARTNHTLVPGSRVQSAVCH